MENLENDVLDKLYRYLSYQERCRQDIENKLFKLQVPKQEHASYIKYLEEQNYLSEQRYTQQYVASKIRGNQWGKRKVRYALRRKNIPEPLVNQVLQSFPSEEYTSIANQLAAKKASKVQTDDERKLKQKVYRYLAQKGFESGLIWSAIENIPS